MRWLLFIHRLAFVCNVFFVLAVSLQLGRLFRNPDAEAIVLILGFFMAGVLNPFANLSVLFLFFTQREKISGLPKWLLIVNFVFFVLQLIYFFQLHAQ